MLKLAICDDHITDLSNMVSHVNDYKSLHSEKLEIVYTTFSNAVDLIASMEHGESYDIVLLDIMMPMLTGMDAAKEIRQFNHDIKIIFATSSPEFAVESYAVNAYYYTLKPLKKEKLFELFDKILSEMTFESNQNLMIKGKSGLMNLYIHRLEFAEVIGRIILYHLTDGTVIESISTMAELEKSVLIYPCFIKPHRSYIVNMGQIDTLSKRDIKMKSLNLVPIAKANFKTVKSTYMDYAFKNLQKHK